MPLPSVADTMRIFYEVDFGDDQKVLMPRLETRYSKMTITELKRINRENGGKWFSPGAMKAFDSKVESRVLGPDKDGNYYFVSSETTPGFELDARGPRRFAVRKATMPNARITTVGRTQQYSEKQLALDAIRKLIEAE